MLDPSSTNSKYILRFLNKVFVGFGASVGVSAEIQRRVFSAAEMEVIRAMPKSEHEEFLRNL
jgi:hypothetical protein